MYKARHARWKWFFWTYTPKHAKHDVTPGEFCQDSYAWRIIAEPWRDPEINIGI